MLFSKMTGIRGLFAKKSFRKGQIILSIPGMFPVWASLWASCTQKLKFSIYDLANESSSSQNHALSLLDDARMRS